MPEPQFPCSDNHRVKFSQNTINQSQNSMQKTSISKQYCFNKPKIIKEFQNSKLLRNTLNTQFLKSYSPRYTYNQKTRNFQKENNQFIQSQYDVDYSLIQNLNKSKSTQIPKLILLRKKSQKNLNSNTERSLSPNDFTSKSSLNGQSTKNFPKDNENILQNKQSKQKSILRKIGEKRGQSTTRNIIDCFSAKQTPQNIKHYIRTNPINYTPLNLESFKGKINRIKNIRIPTVGRRTEKVENNQTNHSFFNTKLLKSSNIFEDTIETKQLEVGSAKQNFFKSLQEEIQRLYDIIRQLRLLGYAQEKVNEWIWAYCENNKKFMQSILFKAQGYKTSLAQHKIIYKLQQIDIAKTNCKRFKRTINNQDIPLQPSDISDMTNHLQQILISKQYFELKRLQTQIQDTSYAIKNNYINMQDEKGQDILKLIESFNKKKKLKPMEYYETLNFYQDAKRLEAHFGKVKGLTTANKRKCQNLTQIEIQIIRNKK